MLGELPRAVAECGHFDGLGKGEPAGRRTRAREKVGEVARAGDVGGVPVGRWRRTSGCDWSRDGVADERERWRSRRGEGGTACFNFPPSERGGGEWRAAPFTGGDKGVLAPFEEGGGGIWGRHGKAFDAKRGAHTDGKNGADIGAAEDAREPVGEGKGQRGFCERSVVVGQDEGLDAAFGGEALPFFVGEWTGEDIARGEGDADARDGEPRHAEGGERPKARWSEWATERGNEGREVGEGEERDD